MNIEKCVFFKTKVNYLGHIISPSGIQPEKKKIEEIIDFKVPRNTTDVKAFLGMAGFYKKFIKDFAHKSHPLCHLLKKGVKF